MDLVKIAKAIRKTFHCNAAVVQKKNHEEIAEENLAKREEGGYMTLEEMMAYQTMTKGQKKAFDKTHEKPMLHLGGGEVIILQGDYREGVMKLFSEAQIVMDSSRLVIHG